MCEKCWADAYLRAMVSGQPQSQHYRELLNERKDRPCSPQEQAGQFWDAERGEDRRQFKRSGHG